MVPDLDSWHRPPAMPALAAGEIHVWRLDLDPAAAVQRELWTLLDADERRRADRFHFEHHRRRFVVARGSLRRLLGRYLGRPPTRVGFVYGAQGKPRLAASSHGPRLEFNVSHSDRRALLAIGLEAPVGVDLEHIRTHLAAEALAETVFSRAELVELRSLPPWQRVAAFFNGWCRKEAFIKACGEGLSYGLDRFDVSLAPFRPARILRTREDPTGRCPAFLAALHPYPGYAAALVVHGQPSRVRCLEWTHEGGAR